MLQQVYKDMAITLLTADGTTIDDLKDKKVKALFKHLKKVGTSKGWTFQITLVGSEHKSNMSIKCKVQDGKGRPKTVFYEPKRLNCKTAPHAHAILENAHPNTAITAEINKYWTKREGMKTTHFKNVYDKGGFRGYMDAQASFTRSMCI